MIRGIAFTLALLVAPFAARADFILDDFSTPQIPGSIVPISGFAPVATAGVGAIPTGPPVMGIARVTGTVSIVDGVTASLNDFDFVPPPPFPGGPATAEIIYDFAPSSSPTVNPAENFVFLRDVNTTSGGTLTVTFGNTSSLTTPFSSVSFTSAGAISDEDIQIDITSISNIQDTDLIAFRYDADVFGGSFSTSQIDFSSVPEPASLALASLGVVGFGMVRRRRRKQQAAAVAA